MRGRQGIPLPRGLERPGRGSVEDPDCRTAAQGRLALARQRGRAPGGLQQPRSAALRGGEAGHARPGGTGRALVCAHPGPGWPAPDVAAGPGEYPQALSDPRCWAQSRAADAPAHRGRNPEGGRGERLVFFRPAPDQQWRIRGSHHGSPRPQRHPSSDRREHALRPSLRLNKHFVNGLLSRALFVEAKLAGANVRKAEVNRADFSRADLTGADLSKAEVARAVFTNANLSGVRFSYADLARANLNGLDLAGVDFTGAYLFLTQVKGADLSRAVGLTQAQLALACGTSETKLPSGMVEPDTWPCPPESD